jgi:hypothetical protein
MPGLCGCSSVVEHNLAKVGVARSIRVIRLVPKQLLWGGERSSGSFRLASLVELVDTLVLGTSAFGLRVRVPREAVEPRDCLRSSVVEHSIRNAGATGSSPVEGFRS